MLRINKTEYCLILQVNIRSVEVKKI